MDTRNLISAAFVVAWECEFDEYTWDALGKAVAANMGLRETQTEPIPGLALSQFQRRRYVADDGRAAVAEPFRLLLQGREWADSLENAAESLGDTLSAVALTVRATGVNCHFAGRAPTGIGEGLIEREHPVTVLVAGGGGVVSLKASRPYGEGALSSEVALPPASGGGMVVKLNWHTEHAAIEEAAARLSRYGECIAELARLAAPLFAKEGVTA